MQTIIQKILNKIAIKTFSEEQKIQFLVEIFENEIDNNFIEKFKNEEFYIKSYKEFVQNKIEINENYFLEDKNKGCFHEYFILKDGKFELDLDIYRIEEFIEDIIESKILENDFLEYFTENYLEYAEDLFQFFVIERK